MPPRITRCLIAVVVLANISAAALYSGAGPNDPATRGAGGRGRAVLEAVADLLTLPIATPGITDVRDVALIAALGLALLLVAMAGERGESAGAGGRRYAAVRWLTGCGAAVAGLALVSAAVNGTLDFSWGWIVRFVTGVAWVALIARCFNALMVRQTLTGLLAIALCCLALTIVDRAEREVTLFRWPIGPITTTAGLAAVWAAVAGAWAVGSAFYRRIGWGTAGLVACTLISAYVLQQTGRRAAGLGLVAAAVAAGALLFWSQYRSRILNVCIVGFFVVAAGVAAVWIGRQMSSPTREVSGSVDLRLAYWKLSAKLVAERPLLGDGPDMFVVAMTDAVEPLRSESPHFYHGNLDLYAHNEWIQAVVEMGVPAALAYLGLPLGLMYMAVRRLRPGAAPAASTTSRAVIADDGSPDPVLVVTLLAGLIAVLVTECASITLRTPMMPVWYWTLLGLLAATIAQPAAAAVSQGGAGEGVRPAALRWPGRISAAAAGLLTRPAALVAGTVACFALTGMEMSRAVAQERKERGVDGRFASRLYGDKTISGRYDAFVLAGRAAEERRDPAAIATAVSLGRELYGLFPALHDTPALYAHVLELADHKAAARAVLEEALSLRHNPYDLTANLLYAQVRADDPIERLRCVQRALRAAALDADLQRILAEVMDQAAVGAYLDRELAAARAVAEGGSESLIAESAVELLRVNAFIDGRRGRMSAAIVDQRAAADFYRRLEEESSRYRRASPAEIDAFYVLARMIYDAEPDKYMEAFAAITEAEHYAILSIAHERVAEPHPEQGEVWGELVPVEFPERLRPVWRLSALLHLVAGRDTNIDARIFSCLPPEQWNTESLDREKGALVREALAGLGRLPPEQRPAHYRALEELARRYGAAAPEEKETAGPPPHRDPGS